LLPLLQTPLQRGDLLLLLQQLLLETIVALLQSLAECLEGGSDGEKKQRKYLPAVETRIGGEILTINRRGDRENMSACRRPQRGRLDFKASYKS